MGFRDYCDELLHSSGIDSGRKCCLGVLNTMVVLGGILMIGNKI